MTSIKKLVLTLLFVVFLVPTTVYAVTFNYDCTHLTMSGVGASCTGSTVTFTTGANQEANDLVASLDFDLFGIDPFYFSATVTGGNGNTAAATCNSGGGGCGAPTFTATVSDLSVSNTGSPTAGLTIYNYPGGAGV